MWLVLAAAMLASATDAPPAPGPAGGVTFKSTKTLDALERCLSDKLADVGEVVSVHNELNSTTLVVRDIPEGPMTIELAPPLITVTSHYVPEAGPRIAKCL